MWRECQLWPNVTLSEDVIVRQWKHWPVNGPFVKFLKLCCHLVESLKQWQNRCWTSRTPAEYTCRVSGFCFCCELQLHFQVQPHVKTRQSHHRWRLSRRKYFWNRLRAICKSTYFIFIFSYFTILSSLLEGGGFAASESTSMRRLLLSKQV